MLGRDTLQANTKLWVYWHWMTDDKSIITFEKDLEAPSALGNETPKCI